jgi:hypothetical protein
MTQLAGFVIGISLTNFLNQIYFLDLPPAQLARMQTRQAIEYIKILLSRANGRLPSNPRAYLPSRAPARRPNWPAVAPSFPFFMSNEG